MADTVDDSSTADVLLPSDDPSDHEDDVESLQNVTGSLPPWPVSLQGTAADTMLDIHSISEDAYGTRRTMKISVSGKANLDFHQPNARDDVHQASNAASNGFSFKSTGIDLGSSEERREFIKQRFPRPALEQSDRYTPYVRISNRVATKKLIKIAQDFTLLDQVFAECFRAFEEAFNHKNIRERLLRIRNDLAKSQRHSSGPDNSQDQAGYIGPLGEFCENVCASWKEPASNRKVKGYKNGLKYGDDYLVYLQNTLEIPYWQLVIDLLLDWRETNASNILGTAILYLLRYKVLSCGNQVEELAQMAIPDAEDRDGLTTVVRSIQKRLDFLDYALEVVMPGEVEITASAITGFRGVHSELGSGISRATPSTKHDASKQLALFVLFNILAFIPGYRGFAISAQSHENGTTNDADFYYLMQSSIMSVLGNFAAALPLLQSARISGPCYFFWAFSAMGLLSAVLSVVIYPYTNTGWSSVVSFVGSVASAASVLVLTVATAREQMIGPGSRNDGEDITKGSADRNGKLKKQ